MSDVHHLTAVSLEVSSGRERLARGLRLLLEDVDCPRAKRRVRKPSIRRMIAAAEKTGKNVTSITTPDGVTLHFGKGESTEASNPWLDDLKVTKQ
jgi:hypothetical protein